LNLGGKHHRGAQDPECPTATFRPWINSNRLPALAPPPPYKGKIIGLDCHPDTFTAAVFVGHTPHDARKIGSRENLSL
jgi:hypothetical protein